MKLKQLEKAILYIADILDQQGKVSPLYVNQIKSIFNEQEEPLKFPCYTCGKEMIGRFGDCEECSNKRT